MEFDQIKYTLDFFHDDQPRPVKVKMGRLISVPYSLEMNDVVVLGAQQASPREYTKMLKAQFDQSYQEGAESRALTEALERMLSRGRVWPATGAEILQAFKAQK